MVLGWRVVGFVGESIRKLGLTNYSEAKCQYARGSVRFKRVIRALSKECDDVNISV